MCRTIFSRRNWATEPGWLSSRRGRTMSGNRSPTRNVEAWVMTEGITRRANEAVKKRMNPEIGMHITTDLVASVNFYAGS